MYATRRLHREGGGNTHAVHVVPFEHAQVELHSRAPGRVGSRNAEGHGGLGGGVSRIRHARRVAQLLSALLLVVTGLPAQVGAEPSTVIVLSWDGTRHDYPERAETPALDRLQRDGARAERLIPVFPASTFPNHVSLATGTYPDVHGIVANRFTDTERGEYDYSNDASWIHAEPLWVAAERQGVRSATYFWVGSETDWEGRGASYRKAPFRGADTESTKVEQIIRWLEMDAAVRPRLIMSWWHGCDSVGHNRGPDHPDIALQLVRQDVQLARLLEVLDARGLWESTTLLIVSDHGMTEARATLDVMGTLEAASIGARLVRVGGAGYLWLDDPEQRSEALRVLDALEGMRAYPSDSMPSGLRSYRPGRSGHLTLVAEPPFVLYGPSMWQRLGLQIERALGAKRGVHGYRPDHPDMGAIFYAAGRGVAPGIRLSPVRAIDIAATVSALLGIEPPAQSEGRAIPGVGTPLELASDANQEAEPSASGRRAVPQNR